MFRGMICCFRSMPSVFQISWTVTNSRFLVVELNQLLDELVDPVLARQRACVLLDQRECDRVVVLVDVG